MTAGPNYIGTLTRDREQCGRGVVDEFHMYSGAGTATPLARRRSRERRERVPRRPGQELLPRLRGDRRVPRGQYLYLGADSQFRGLNVALATPGAGVAAGDLDWQYWNGTAWTNLESVGGFTDLTKSFTRTGNIFWQDPPGWSPYSVNGGPDLYYVRVQL